MVDQIGNRGSRFRLVSLWGQIYKYYRVIFHKSYLLNIDMKIVEIENVKLVESEIDFIKIMNIKLSNTIERSLKLKDEEVSYGEVEDFHIKSLFLYGDFEAIHESIQSLEFLKKLIVKKHNNQSRGISKIILPNSIGNLSHLEILVLSEYIELFLPETFKNLKNLKEITLATVNLQNTDMLNNINSPKLEYFNLVSENLTSIEKQFFNQNIYLKTLYLECISIENLSEALGDLKELESLTIKKGIFLRNIPDGLCELNKLVNLKIEQTGLIKIPENIGLLHNLKKLSISWNRLKALPPSICKLFNLVELKVDHNNITKLPDEIGAISCLEELFLNNNKLQEIPSSFGNLRKLKIVDFSNNELNNFPEIKCNFQFTTKINLYRNKLTKLHPSIGKMVGLQELNLNSNFIQYLPDSIGDFLKLEKFTINTNKLSQLPDSMKKLKNMMIFEISSNKLQEIPDIFGLWTKLKNLDLSRNQISSLPASISKLEKLQEFFVGFNKIENFPYEIENLLRIETLDLSNNQIANLSKKVKIPKSLTFLNMSKNPKVFKMDDFITKDKLETLF
ncbi:hypothetical protein NEF87_000044 [Candidatus Lokiarchaeum ossiferum]|uniref:Disease resistance R13L4/SHOC-2-like LRR domain-containing protein n=1 Tax=Candidatus Lokiarchaeum ossiferum TaxID=2951803 RepID=A0ABY6HMF6_9ARCH|nr:hypothetical protein NEF87_000044 [Candidatus Lokiarchaeum sp. B-35]